MTPRLWFDASGPDRIARMRLLFSEQSRLQVKYAKPEPRKFRWSRLQATAERIVAKCRRAA